MGIKLACLECGFIGDANSPDIERTAAGKYRCLGGHIMRAFNEEPVRAGALYFAVAIAVPVLLCVAVWVGFSLAAERAAIPRFGVFWPFAIGCLYVALGLWRVAVASRVRGDDDLIAYYRSRRAEGIGMLSGGAAAAAAMGSALVFVNFP